jgi:hypothetical protein
MNVERSSGITKACIAFDHHKGYTVFDSDLCLRILSSWLGIQDL